MHNAIIIDKHNFQVKTRQFEPCNQKIRVRKLERRSATSYVTLENFSERFLELNNPFLSSWIIKLGHILSFWVRKESNSPVLPSHILKTANLRPSSIALRASNTSLSLFKQTVIPLKANLFRAMLDKGHWSNTKQAQRNQTTGALMPKNAWNVI